MVRRHLRNELPGGKPPSRLASARVQFFRCEGFGERGVLLVLVMIRISAVREALFFQTNPWHRLREETGQFRSGLHHLSFRARSRAEVDSCYALLKESGAKIEMFLCVP